MWKALNDFRGEQKDGNKPCVLLLPINQGANGLNLVEAQHVIMIEPLLNPAAEAQAVNRVHRIGQTRETCVHRFVVEVRTITSLLDQCMIVSASFP